MADLSIPALLDSLLADDSDGVVAVDRQNKTFRSYFSRSWRRVQFRFNSLADDDQNLNVRMPTLRWLNLIKVLESLSRLCLPNVGMMLRFIEDKTKVSED